MPSSSKRRGYVDPEGKPLPIASQKVSPGVVTFKTLEYDVAASAIVTVTTNVPSKPTLPQPSKATAVSATNAKRVALLRTFSNPAAVTNLYPFKDSAYAFFTGNCAYENPENLGIANYFSLYPGSLIANPTPPQPKGPVTVRQPPFNLRVTRTSPALTVYAKLVPKAGDPCTEPRVQMALKAWPIAWGAAPQNGGNWVVRNDATFDPGMPFGTYEICVQDTAPNPDQYQTFTYDNRAPGGQTATVNNPGSWSNGTCSA